MKKSYLVGEPVKKGEGKFRHFSGRGNLAINGPEKARKEEWGKREKKQARGGQVLCKEASAPLHTSHREEGQLAA